MPDESTVTRRAIFITGAGGFVGRGLAARLIAAGRDVTALVRRPWPDAPPGLRTVVGDLNDPSTYRESLRRDGVVLHLAARTGIARPRVYQRDNVEATKTLVETAKAVGIARFIFVSSVAAAFRDLRFYPYGRSKLAAEAIVQASGLEAAILRPMLILGPGSPTLAGFRRLAFLPRGVIFGDGRVRVAPIHVDDVGAIIARAADAPIAASPAPIYDLAGPESLDLDELVGRLRAARGLAPGILHLPLAPLRRVLALLEPIFLPIMPVTAGQLASFAEDGVASHGPLPPELAIGGLRDWRAMTA